jgi:riboflavin kinase/FMN adenylyltransferase
MIYINSLDFTLKSSAACIGNFDGFHAGHQKVFEQIKNKEFPSVIFSFYPHPSQVLRNTSVPLLLTRAEKRAVFEAAGADYYIEAPFSREFADLTPTRFFNDIILKKLNAKYLSVGEGYKFGANKDGSASALKYMCLINGVSLSIVPHETKNGKISSSNIRELIINAEFDSARELLGRPYFITGEVVRGKAVGRTIGFPTANILPSDGKALPKDGIFVTQTIYNGIKYNSVTNIGKNPTLGAGFRTVETHLFEFNEDIYDREITVLFYKKIRDVVKFNNLNELKNRISIDAEESKNYFKSFYLDPK